MEQIVFSPKQPGIYKEPHPRISRDHLIALVTGLHGWLKQEHGLELDKKIICVAVSVSNLNNSFEDREAVKAIVLQRAQQKFLAVQKTDTLSDTLRESLKKTGGKLPWDILPTGNFDDDEGNRAKAIQVVSQYCTDFNEPLGPALWHTCLGKELSDSKVKKKGRLKKNKGKRLQNSNLCHSLQRHILMD
jgi:hypothetical protein